MASELNATAGRAVKSEICVNGSSRSVVRPARVEIEHLVEPVPQRLGRRVAIGRRLARRPWRSLAGWWLPGCVVRSRSALAGRCRKSPIGSAGRCRTGSPGRRSRGLCGRPAQSVGLARRR